MMVDKKAYIMLILYRKGRWRQMRRFLVSLSLLLVMVVLLGCSSDEPGAVLLSRYEDDYLDIESGPARIGDDAPVDEQLLISEPIRLMEVNNDDDQEVDGWPILIINEDGYQNIVSGPALIVEPTDE